MSGDPVPPMGNSIIGRWIRWIGLRLTVLLLAVLASGCGGQKAKQTEEEEVLVLPDTPLVLRLNGKSQIFLNNRWVDLFGEQVRVRDYLQRISDRYRQVYEEQGIPSLQQRQGNKIEEIMPTDVLIETERKTKTGSILFVQRLCREYGFGKFQVKVAEEPEGGGP